GSGRPRVQRPRTRRRANHQRRSRRDHLAGPRRSGRAHDPSIRGSGHGRSRGPLAAHSLPRRDPAASGRLVFGSHGRAMTDLAVVGGRVLDPGQGIDDTTSVRISDGVITGIGWDARATQLDASGLIVVPGLVDLHTHLYRGVSHYGIDADAYCLDRGVTTAVDAGSSGAQTFPGLRRYIIEPARTRILA